MRKTAVAVALSLFLAVSTYHANAASLAGVTIPDTAQAGGKTLVLNGLGIRSKMMVKVYVGGLYLPQKSSDANSILKSDGPKQIVMKFTHAVSKSQMVDGFAEGIGDNSPDAKKTMQPDIDK